jgi:hypothetical protein
MKRSRIFGLINRALITPALINSLLPALVLIAALAVAPLASSQEKVLFPFGAASTFTTPFGTVTSDQKGNLYFIANGNCNSTGYCATVWELLPPSQPNGQWGGNNLVNGVLGYAETGLVRDSEGNLYGTTSGGAKGYGYVFQAIPPSENNGDWSYKDIYDFQTGSYAPFITLALDAAQNLYGGYFGNVFQLKRPATRTGSWTESVIYAAPGDPTAVILGKAGNVFGATATGGTSGSGIVFELTPPATSGGSWTEQTLYNFPSSPTNAIHPARSRQNAGLSPKGLDLGSENILSLDAKGNLYGTQPYGGTGGVGYVFELAPPATSGGTWTYSTLYNFTGSAAGSTDGAYPGAAVLPANGNLYGTTYLGGNSAGTLDGSLGTIFELTPPSTSGGTWTETILRRFTAGFDGANPGANFILGKGNVLYSITNFGGNDQVFSGSYMPGSGTVFSIVP